MGVWGLVQIYYRLCSYQNSMMWFLVIERSPSMPSTRLLLELNKDLNTLCSVFNSILFLLLGLSVLHHSPTGWLMRFPHTFKGSDAWPTLKHWDLQSPFGCLQIKWSIGWLRRVFRVEENMFLFISALKWYIILANYPFLQLLIPVSLLSQSLFCLFERTWLPSRVVNMSLGRLRS